MISLTSPEPFIQTDLPCPVTLSSYGDAIQTIHHYVGLYASRLNDIAVSRGFESRQRALYALVHLVFFWKEKSLPVAALDTEVPGILDWAESNSLTVIKS